MTTTLHEKSLFIFGILAATASKEDLITYDELRRFSRLSDRQLGTFLGNVRGLRGPAEPDICAVVIKTLGSPGWGWGNLATWQAEVQKVWDYWRDRRQMDNGPFATTHGDLPALPGLGA